MKKGLIFIGILLLLASCKDKIRQEYMANTPVYMDYESFRASGGFEAPTAITKAGNIYFKDNFLFMVEPDKGIHFIDNSNPSAPVQTGFLKVLGATGMAIKDNYLYVNSFIDLVVYDISSLSNPVIVDRLEDLFPTVVPVSDKNYPYQTIDKNKGVVVSWEVKKITEDVTDQQPNWIGCVNCTIEISASNQLFDTQSSVSGNSGTGVSGSISLFTIMDNYLYIMDLGQILHPIEITDPSHPVAHEIVQTWNNVETLFPYENYLFMGTPSGILIYETGNPQLPTQISSLSHARGCDPVVVQDGFAYVTVRSGGPCGGDINQLDIIDVSTIENPTLLKSYALDNPHGLGIDGTKLFVCDGDSGLKVFDASNPIDTGDNLIKRFKNIQATDVIPFNNVAMVIGEDGIYQYDYSNPEEMVFLSKIKF